MSEGLREQRGARLLIISSLARRDGATALTKRRARHRRVRNTASVPCRVAAAGEK